MMHGFLLEGDRAIEAIAVTSRVIMNQTAEFLGKFVRQNVHHIQVDNANAEVIIYLKELLENYLKPTKGNI